VGFAELPARACWRHVEASEGFEVVFFGLEPAGVHIQGGTAAIEEGHPWLVGYDIRVDDTWHTRLAQVTGVSEAGRHEVTLESDGDGHWRVNGVRRPDLHGCLDVDLESSACTNTLPVHRLALTVGGHAKAPAVYVRALDLAVERLEQQYLRLDDEGPHPRFDYRSPAFEYHDVLMFDGSGLVLDYPGIASRVST
jgi:uncharacterized protein